MSIHPHALISRKPADICLVKTSETIIYIRMYAIVTYATNAYGRQESIHTHESTYKYRGGDRIRIRGRDTTRRAIYRDRGIPL